jgi:hypothetical protein
MVAHAFDGMAWASDINDTLTVLVLVQYVLLYQHLQAVQLSPKVPDQLQWCWSSNGLYSSWSAYAALLFGQTTVPRAVENMHP